MLQYNMGHRQDCTWTSSALLGEERATSVLVSFLLPIKRLVRKVLSFCDLVGAIGRSEFLSALRSLYSNLFFMASVTSSTYLTAVFSFNVFDAHVVIEFSFSLPFVYIVCSQIQLHHVKLFLQ